MYRCEECGYSTQTTNQGNTCPVCGKRMDEIRTAEPAEETFAAGEPVAEEIVVEEVPQKKNKKGATGIISTIIIILVARFVGGLVGGGLANNFMGGSPEKKIDKFIKKVEKYEPGTFEDGVYKSKYWGMKIEAEQDWEEMSDADLKASEEGARESAIESAIESLKKDGVDDEALIEKFKESIYCKTEAGFMYESSGMIEGLSYITVFSGYGIGEMSESEVTDGLMEEYTKLMTNSEEGKATLGGKKYRYIDGVMVESGMEMNARIYVRTEGVMVSMMPVMYVGEDYNEFIDSFESMVSAY